MHLLGPRKHHLFALKPNIIHALLAVISESEKWIDSSQLFSSICFGYFQILVTATNCMPCFLPCIDIDQIQWTIVIYIGTHVIFLLHHHFYFNWIFYFTTLSCTTSVDFSFFPLPFFSCWQILFLTVYKFRPITIFLPIAKSFCYSYLIESNCTVSLCLQFTANTSTISMYIEAAV